MNNGVRVDLDKLLEGKKDKANNKDSKKYSIDDIRQFDINKCIMERIRNRGNMTMQDYLMWSDYKDRRNNSGNNNSGNDEIKALREEIKAMQENFERRFKEDEE